MEYTTSVILLAGLRASDNESVWRRFVGRYEPLLLAFSRRLGLGESDARDAVQETMLAFVRAWEEGGFDSAKGRLRSWLFGIAHCKVVDVHRRRARETVMSDRTGGTGFLASIQSRDDAKIAWDREWQQALLRACVSEVSRLVKPRTFAAFEPDVLREWSTARVADHLGITENAVYIAKNRVISRIREIRPQLEEAW